MPSSLSDRVLALGGIFQAAGLVQRAARTGQTEAAPFEASIRSIFTIDAPSIEDVFGGARGVEYGLALMGKLFGTKGSPEDMEITKYVIGVLTLARKLVRNGAMVERLRIGIEKAAAQAEVYSPTHANVLASLADTYSNTLSTLAPRIMVNGEHVHLNNPDNANRIRALLLAGIRAAVLWNQAGGSRLQLVFGRNKLVAEAERLLAELPTLH